MLDVWGIRYAGELDGDELRPFQVRTAGSESLQVSGDRQAGLHAGFLTARCPVHTSRQERQRVRDDAGRERLAQSVVDRQLRSAEGRPSLGVLISSGGALAVACR